jgi:hypothetical protein
MRKWQFVIPLIVLAPLAGACASASAKTPGGDRPDLMIPPPPPHVIPINAEPIVEPVSELPAGTGSTGAPAGRGSGRGNRESSPRPAGDTKPEAKPEAKPPETPPPPEPVPVAPPTPAPQLRTTESSAAEAAVRASIDRTKSLLANVDYRRLTTARRRAYDDAKRFSQQAEDALKAGNAIFAQGMATKAETLAKELAGG